MRLFATLIDVYSVIVLLAVVMSWFRLGPRNPVATTLYSLTEPVKRAGFVGGPIR